MGGLLLYFVDQSPDQPQRRWIVTTHLLHFFVLLGNVKILSWAFSQVSLTRRTLIILYPVEDMMKLGEHTRLTHQDHYCQVHGQWQHSGQFDQHWPYLSPLAPQLSLCFGQVCSFHFAPVLALFLLFLATHNPFCICKSHFTIFKVQLKFPLHGIISGSSPESALLLVSHVSEILGCIAEKPTQTGLNNKGNL